MISAPTECAAPVCGRCDSCQDEVISVDAPPVAVRAFISTGLIDTDFISVYRCADGCRAEVHHTSGGVVPLQHILLHSPTGFEYGYYGSGPADLALSILTACINPATALEYYQMFKGAFVAKQGREAWQISVGEVRDWVMAIIGRA